MKIQKPPQVLSDGTIDPAHTIEVVCANCQDPVSEQEVETGTCTKCGEAWQVAQNVDITVTSMPGLQGLTINIG